MGGSDSKNELQKINPSEWSTIGQDNGSEIVKNNQGKEAQLRVIPSDPKHEVDKQLKIYTYRKNTESPLVQCYGAEFSKSEHKTVCGNQQNVKVLTERIPKRLQNINSLTFTQSLCILSESFRGFQDLTQKAGNFQVTDKMIGFNNNGQVKVWLNQNYAQNHPAFERPILQTTMTASDLFAGPSTQKRMLQNVLDIVESKTENGRFPEDFRNQIQKNNNFIEAYNNLHEYIKNKNIFVPGRLSQIEQSQTKQKVVGSFLASSINKQANNNTNGNITSTITTVNQYPNSTITNTRNIMRQNNINTNGQLNQQYQYMQTTPISYNKSPTITLQQLPIISGSQEQVNRPVTLPAYTYTYAVPSQGSGYGYTNGNGNANMQDTATFGANTTVNFSHGNTYGVTHYQPYRSTTSSGQPLSPRTRVMFNYANSRQY